MAENTEMEMDPAIAAAMGFSGFGTQPGKKRKFNDDAFVDPEAANGSKTVQSEGIANGPNNLPLGEKTGHEGKTSATASSQSEGAAGETAQPAASTSGTGDDPAQPSLEALSQGVRNGRGDLVYFMPSFVEDPWKDLVRR